LGTDNVGIGSEHVLCRAMTTGMGPPKGSCEKLKRDIYVNTSDEALGISGMSAGRGQPPESLIVPLEFKNDRLEVINGEYQCAFPALCRA